MNSENSEENLETLQEYIDWCFDVIVMKKNQIACSPAKSETPASKRSRPTDSPETTSPTDEISVKKGEELKLGVLLSNAYKVVHWTKRSTGRKEDWIRSHGVRRDRMTIRDGNLIINNFTASDAGTYEVLDIEGQILIMVTVTDEISVKTGEQLKLPVLLASADKVETNSSGE
ncbi:hypothetical protein Q8A67_015980 [Cirrhinus molitorella]|uniref:Uncharacterized protein n=1 Tax=Cirrhinus molitorella TaxID=172907 RepID=A0AA88TTX2_9TELE|nr:hypothetical protein Q8A67_015980 [Cirrhinus molitorella]